MLVESARRLCSVFERRSDVVGRLGGDELVVVVEGAHATDPKRAAQRPAWSRSRGGRSSCPREQATIGAPAASAWRATAMHAHQLEDAGPCRRRRHGAAEEGLGKGGFVVAGNATKPASRRCNSQAAWSISAATRDALIGLPDRRTRGRLARAHRHHRGKRIVAVVCVDLDDWASVNLRYMGRKLRRSAVRGRAPVAAGAAP
ncbi:MAG: hypothetical protein U1F67_02950 [Rubrivivax sp.]